MNRRRLGTGYAIGVGVTILGLWSVLLATGKVPELTTAPLEVGVHLLAEFATALGLLLAGVARSQGWQWTDRPFPFALGTLLYTTTNSAGYYAGLGAWGLVAGFGLLTATTVVVLRWELDGAPRNRVDATRGSVT